MSAVNRVLGFICTYAACDNIFPPPNVPINLPQRGLAEIRTNSGYVQGYYMNTIVGNLIGAFEGIPYAEPPIGSLRFRDPVKKRPWNRTIFADRKISCIQMDPLRYYRVTGDEDCLHLNIYVPLERKKKGDFPVFVWVHGGAYFWGAGNHYGPSYFLDNDIILVTINYRLGPLGFLSTEDGESSGNYGLKDQSMALTWIQENIQYFGGDPRKVTLAGQSAGASSAHLHMMSPWSKGKFQRAISHSGSALSHWALPRNPYQLTARLANNLGCLPGRSVGVVECLRRKSAKNIVANQYKLLTFLEFPPILFGPVVEKNRNGFLLDTPDNLYAKGSVANIPWITGVTRDEGDLFTLVSYLGPLATRQTLMKFEASAPEFLMYDKNDIEKTRKIKSFYLSKFPRFSFGGYEALSSLSKMVGDRFFYVPFDKTLEVHSRTVRAPLFGYYFSFKGKHGIPDKFHVPASEWGVLHQDDLQYLFNSTELYVPLARSDKEYILARYFAELWANFAENGEPSIISNKVEYRDWVPYSPESPRVLEINFNGGMIKKPHQEAIQFWNSL